MTIKTEQAVMIERATTPIYLNSDQVDILLLALTRAQISSLGEIWDYKTKESLRPILREEARDYHELFREILTQLAK